MSNRKIAFMILVFSATIIFAQSNIVNKRLLDFQKKLDLSEEQVQKIKLFFMEEKNLHPDEIPDPRKNRQLAKKMDMELKKILTPQQYKKYNRLLISRAVEKQLTVMEIKIGLNETQVDSVREIATQGMLDIRRIRFEVMDKNERLVKIRQIFKTMDTAIEALLNSRQIEKYEIYKEERRKRVRDKLLQINEDLSTPATPY